MERFTPLVWATVRGHRLGDADAADVVQTTWLRLVEHLGQIQEPERVGAWLATTARRESLRVLSAGGRTVPTEQFDDLRDERRGPAEAAIERDRDARLRGALGRLGTRCSTLLRLLAADPPPAYADVSEALGMPIGSIGPTRRRCLEQLRAELDQLGISGAS